MLFRSDVIARIGGDEFAVILKGVGEELLATIMERAKQMLEQGSFLSEQGLKVRFSLGCATTESPSRLQEAIRAADMAMYEDKKLRKLQEIQL